MIEKITRREALKRIGRALVATLPLSAIYASSNASAILNSTESLPEKISYNSFSHYTNYKDYVSYYSYNEYFNYSNYGSYCSLYQPYPSKTNSR